jgi:hypothetical protein
MAFEFVSVYDPNSKAKRHLPLIRSYAAQHGIRARKQNRSLMGNATGAFQFRFLAAKETDDMHDDDEEGSVVDAKAQYDPRQASPPAVDRDGSQTSLSLPHENLCSQGTIDPFVSLPVPMGKRVETLFHHCKFPLKNHKLVSSNAAHRTHTPPSRLTQMYIYLVLRQHTKASSCWITVEGNSTTPQDEFYCL